jgi:membrane protein
MIDKRSHGLATLWKPGGITWKELLSRVWNKSIEDNVIDRAAVLSFYFQLSLFPLLLFLTSLLGLFAQYGSELRADLLSYLSTIAPRSASALIYTTLDEITEGSSGGKLSFGLLLALWTATSGMVAIIEALNTAYRVEEARPWWKRRLVALALTITLAVLIITALVLVINGEQIGTAIAGSVGLGNAFISTWAVLQWFIIIAFIFTAFALVYYFAPNVRVQKLRWVMPGMVVGVALWFLVSFAFRFYLHYFNRYSAVYGSLGAVIILMLWFYLTGISILIGGEVNSEIEKAAAQAGESDAKPPGEKEPHQRAEAASSSV